MGNEKARRRARSWSNSSACRLCAFKRSLPFDDVAARILALHRSDLACMTMLLFGGAASVDQLTAALHLQRGAVTATVARLQLAGYARRRPEIGGARIELTEHARRWIERIWEPVREEGD